MTLCPPETMGRIVVESPLSLVVSHPRLPIEVHWGPRSGEAYLIAMAARMDRRDLADAGRWLLEQSGEDLSPAER
ncbi:hypothetical protein GCM10018952_50110 [Streptosporangium vulgare]